jgi:hypothetical protein
VYEWIDMFKQRRTSVTDSECDDKWEEARTMFLMDRMASINIKPIQ